MRDDSLTQKKARRRIRRAMKDRRQTYLGRGDIQQAVCQRMLVVGIKKQR